MRCWRRIVAVLVTLVFASTSALASTPLVWCVAADGHRAIEYKIGSKHADHHALGQSEIPIAGVSGPQSAGDDDCLDWRLVDKAAAAPFQCDHGLLTFDLRVGIPLPALPMPEAFGVAGAMPLWPPESAPSNPQRAALRSVVLRI